MSSSPRLTWPSMSTMTMPCVPQCCGTFLQKQMSARHKGYLALIVAVTFWGRATLGATSTVDWNMQQGSCRAATWQLLRSCCRGGRIPTTLAEAQLLRDVAQHHTDLSTSAMRSDHADAIQHARNTRGALSGRNDIRAGFRWTAVAAAAQALALVLVHLDFHLRAARERDNCQPCCRIFDKASLFTAVGFCFLRVGCVA